MQTWRVEQVRKGVWNAPESTYAGPIDEWYHLVAWNGLFEDTDKNQIPPVNSSDPAAPSKS